MTTVDATMRAGRLRATREAIMTKKLLDEMNMVTEQSGAAIDAAVAAAASGPAQEISGRDAVIKMRDEFLQLVNAYNAVGEYDQAADAQAMAVALHKFEDEHIITEIAWPPRVEQGQYGPVLAEVER